MSIEPTSAAEYQNQILDTMLQHPELLTADEWDKLCNSSKTLKAAAYKPSKHFLKRIARYETLLKEKGYMC